MPNNLPNPPLVSFRNMSNDRYASWRSIGVLYSSPNTIMLDTHELASGKYPYKIKNVVDSPDFYFTISSSGKLYPSDFYFDSLGQVIQLPITIRRNQVLTHDAWSNVLSTTDTMGGLTTYGYNDLNMRTTITEPQVIVMNPDGTYQVQTTTISLGYNLRGSLIGEINGNQKTRAFILNAANQLIRDVLADGSQSSLHVRDIFGRTITLLTNTGQQYQQTYDNNNRIKTSKNPNGNVSTNFFNEMGFLNKMSPPSGLLTCYDYDVNNNITTRYEPGKFGRRMTYDRNHLILTESSLTMDDGVLSWLRDYFGNLSTHKDLTNATYTLTYDLAMRLISKISIGGSHGSTIDLGPYFNAQSSGLEDIGFVIKPNIVLVSGQNLTYQYIADRLISITDVTNKKVTTYIYDINDRRLRVQQRRANQVLLSEIITLYDSRDRELLSLDSKCIFATYFGASGNRISVQSSLFPYGSGHTPIEANNYNAFDDADRILIDAGRLNNGKIEIAANKGFKLSYAKGQRTRQSYIDGNGRAVNSDLTYYNNGLLNTVDTKYADTGLLMIKTSRTYNQDDRFYNYTQKIISAVEIAEIGRTITFYTSDDKDHLDLLGSIRLDYQNQSVYPPQQHIPLVLEETFLQDTLYNSYGVTTSFKQIYHAFSRVNHSLTEDVTDRAIITSVGFEEWLPSQVNVARSANGMASAFGSSYAYYDSNGMRTVELGVVKKVNNQKDPITCHYFYQITPDGLVLAKMSLQAPKTFNPNDKIVISANNVTFTQFIYTANHNYLGSYEIRTDLMSRPYSANNPQPKLNSNYIRHSTSRGVGTPIGFDARQNSWVYENTTTSTAQLGGADFAPTQRAVNARFNLVDTIQPIGIVWMTPRGWLLNGIFGDKVGESLEGMTPSTNLTSHVVKRGDTYETLAAELYGDPAYADQIRLCNTRTSEMDVLSENQVLRLPPLLPIHNSDKTHAPYALFMSTMYEQLYPYVPQMKPKHHTDWFIVMVEAIAVTVAVYVAPHLAPMLLEMLSITAGVTSLTIASAICGAAIAGLSDAAIQGMAVGFGLAERVKWQSVLRSALSGAVAGGFAGYNAASEAESLAGEIGYEAHQESVTQYLVRAAAKEDDTAIVALNSPKQP